VNLQWTVAAPPIVFGHVKSLMIRHPDISAHNVQQHDLHEMDVNPKISNLVTSNQESTVSHDGPHLPHGLVPAISTQEPTIPSMQEEDTMFGNMIDDMVARILTYSKCNQ
jgi:hypothetical protein